MSRHADANEEAILTCAATPLSDDEFEVLDAHSAELGGGFAIRRALPLRERRMIGPFCFLDHIGPAVVGPNGASLSIAPHPHIGLQTVTWLLDGAVLHKDSLGYVQEIRPGQLNVMTSGRGISHSEETPDGLVGRMHGVQLWVALPEADRRCEPRFEHHANVPTFTKDAIEGAVFCGTWQGHTAPGTHFSELVAMDLRVGAGESTLPLESTFEHGLIVLEGAIEVGGRALGVGELLYLRPGRASVCVQASADARVCLVGGRPFGESILMWWNYVARTRDEIVEARHQWEHTEHFGTVDGWGDRRLTAPTVLPAGPRG